MVRQIQRLKSTVSHYHGDRKTRAATPGKQEKHSLHPRARPSVRLNPELRVTGKLSTHHPSICRDNPSHTNSCRALIRFRFFTKDHLNGNVAGSLEIISGLAP